MSSSEAAPLVSIVIPTYQSVGLVADAIDSALAQTHPRCEVIVIDDGSDDGTRALVQRRYGDGVRYRYQDNRGPGAARNAGLAAARGRYIQFLDADDVLLPEKVAAQVEVLERRADVDVVYCDFERVLEDPARTVRHRYRWRYRSGQLWAPLLMGNFVVVHAALARASALAAVGGFDETLATAEDYDLWLRMSAAGFRFHHLPRALVRYRRREGSRSMDRVVDIATTLEIRRRARRARPLRTVGEHAAFWGYSAFLHALMLEERVRRWIGSRIPGRRPDPDAGSP